MLYIRMEDDGVGFPEQVMQYMNFESEDPSREGHHVGLWNIKKNHGSFVSEKGIDPPVKFGNRGMSDRDMDPQNNSSG